MLLDVYKLKLTLLDGSSYYYGEGSTGAFQWWVDKIMAHDKAHQLFDDDIYEEIRTLDFYDVELTTIIIDWKEL